MDNGICKEDIRCFFDRCAPAWDAEMVRNEAVLRRILDNGGIREGIDVLDVACGTGVLFPDYLARSVKSVTAIDLSPEMVRIAAEKYPGSCITVLEGDVEETDFNKRFDAIMVYNAFPHFPEPARLISVLAGLLKPGGRLSVAHGMSRAAIDRHHSTGAHRVSNGLMSETDLAALFSQKLTVDVIVSTDEMYQVCGFRP